jgi:uncharacterized protein (TIGR02217 family)
VASGFDDVLIRYEQPLHRFVLEHANRTQIEHDELLTFFNAVKGMGHRFRVKDYADYAATISNGVLVPLHSTLTVGTSGAGYGTSTYLLQKAYTAGALTTYRNINKPIATVLIYRAGALQTLTTNYTIDYTTGVVTFVADDSQTISSHTVGAAHRMTLSSAIAASAGQRIFITGVTGSAASLLNNLSHAITNVGGGGTIVDVSTTTTGLTASGGTAAMYPQSNQALAWAGEFDVPCRFLSDEASYEIVDRQGSGGGLLYSWSGINLTEVRIALT